MADTEQQKQAPAPVSSGPPTETLSSYSADQRNAALVASNASVPPKEYTAYALPKLPTSVKKGYIEGRGFDVTLCTLGPYEMEQYTAYDWLMMSYAAANEGIKLSISSAWRSNELQAALYKDRIAPDGKTLTASGRKNGRAAPPGWSNHQSGRTLDIWVGLHYGEYEQGKTTPAFEWMKKNGKLFGFDWTEGSRIKPWVEPWHWNHTADKAIGSVPFQAMTGFAVLTAESAAAVASNTQNGVVKLVNLSAHYTNAALARSRSSSRSSRQVLSSAQAAFSAQQSSALSNKVSEVSQGVNYTPPPSFKLDTLAMHVYDFENGVWGDGEPV